MEWLIGIYIVVGIFKTMARYADPNPTRKPLWMLTEKNPMTLLLYGALHTIFWPLIRATK